MKKKLNPFFLLACILIISILGTFIYFIIEFIIEIIDDISKLIENFNFQTLWAIIMTIAFLWLIIFILKNWGKRDDFFLFVVSILNSPSDYIYEKRKNALINYRNEVKQLSEYIYYFSSLSSKEISSEEFSLFLEKVKLQNEFLEKNRKKLESKDNKINIFIQVLFLLLGILTTLFL